MSFQAEMKYYLTSRRRQSRFMVVYRDNEKKLQNLIHVLQKEPILNKIIGEMEHTIIIFRDIQLDFS